ncbi:MAG: T9SS type A sorting domain-containing protein [Bacteroidetes bacterium]|nr:T9SS type A sorting domain-containing protein [Bacteroidota bacterium]
MKQIGFIVLVISLFWGGHTHAQSLKINEVMASNKTIIADHFEEYDDWIEIYNDGNNAVNLAGLYLTDDLSKTEGNLIAGTYPDSTTIEAGDYLLLWADGNSDQGILHFDFKIKSGETVYLIEIENNQAKIIDSVTLPDMASDISFGRYPDGSEDLRIMDKPSPGEENNPDGNVFVEPVTFSENGGFYMNPFYLELNCPDDETEIYFTTDGSIPDDNSLKYVNPIYIRDQSDEENQLSMIQTTIDKGFNYWSEPDDRVKKGTIIRTRSYKGNSHSSVSSQTFFIDLDKHNRYSFPVIVLSLDSLALFHPDSGIYHGGSLYDGSDWESANFAQHGDNWERSAHLEYYVKGDKEIDQNIGLRISGNFTRTSNQKSLRLYARSEYGESKLNYPFFNQLQEDEFKRITLRNSGNDVHHSFMRDPFLQSLVKGQGIDLQESEPVIVFINGEYWGMHYIRERQDKYYLEYHYGIDTDKIDILDGNHIVVEGSDQHYVDMMDYITSNDMSSTSNFEHVTTLMDEDNFRKYIAIEFYIANGDWPYNNIKFWRNQTPGYWPDQPYGHDGRWRWLLFDTDMGMGRSTNTPDKNTFEKSFTSHTSWQSRLIRNLIGSEELPGNEEYRQSLIRLMADYMNTIFHPDRVMPLIDEWAKVLEPEVVEHAGRWGNLSSISSWTNKVDILREYFMNRPGYFRQHIIEQFDDVNDTISLMFDVDNVLTGSIEINGTAIKAQELGKSTEDVYPWTGIYFDNIPIKIQAVPAIGYQFVRWEGIDSDEIEVEFIPQEDIEIKAVFESRENWGQAVINEIYFDVPGEMGGDAIYEFVELHNPGTSTYSLSGHSFDNGISFTFPAGSGISAGSYVVIARDASAYDNLTVPIFEWTSGKLSNSGEALVLKNAIGSVIDSLYYKSNQPWPKGSNGTGYSIELSVPYANNSIPEQWHRSYTSGGTPGSFNSIYQAESQLVINELYAGDSAWFMDDNGEAEDWIELFNPGNLAVNASGLWLSDDANNLTNSIIRPYYADSVIIQPNGFLRFWLDNEENQGVGHQGFKLSKDGESLYLVQADGKTIMDSIVFTEQENDASYGRFPDGGEQWQIMHHPTPNNPNRSDNQVVPTLLINELMAKNYESWENPYGQFEDWIEIYNPGDEPIDIGGLFLSNETDNLLLHRVSTSNPDSTIIEAGSYKYLIADEKPEFGISHLDFKMRSSGGKVFLCMQSFQGTIILDSVDYPRANEGYSYGRFTDGADSWYDMQVFTPGYANVIGNDPLDKIFINEFAAKNYESYPDESGMFEDWIELYNANDFEVELAGLFLSNDITQTEFSEIPGIHSDSVTISANDYLIFRADGGDIQSVTHTNFRLRSSGGFLSLMQKTSSSEWQYIDSVSYESQQEGESFGRISDGNDNWQLFTSPTPNKANGSNSGLSYSILNQNNLQIFPNPSELFLHLNFGHEIRPISIQILSTLGQLVFRQDLNDLSTGSSSQYQIDYPSNMPDGLYWLICHTDEGWISKRFIKLAN